MITACGVRGLALQDGREVDGRGLVKWDGKGGRNGVQASQAPTPAFPPSFLDVTFHDPMEYNQRQGKGVYGR